MLTKGLTFTITQTVTPDKTAEALGSGTLPVYATPAMIALMEEASYKAVAPYLDEGSGSVGTLMNVKHLAATPLGMTVKAQAELLEIDGRRLVFKVTAEDACGIIGEGLHERFIIQNEKFLSRTNAKGQKG